MKISLITLVTPASENIRGTSALPYHLRMGAILNGNVNVNGNFIVYTFNSNNLSDEKIAEVEKELGATIKKVPLPRWYRWIIKFHLLFLRVFLRYPFLNYIKLPQGLVEEIKASQPDLIWVMGEELSRIVKQFPEYRRIQIGPDTESLYYYRMMGRRFVMNNPLSYWKCAIMYRKYARMEREFCTDENFTYYAVGEEDIRHLQQLNPKVNAKFLRHPHYDVHGAPTEQCGVISYELSDSHVEKATESIHFHRPKIKVLIAGRYDLYMKQAADELLAQLLVMSYELSDSRNVNTKNLKLKTQNLIAERYTFTFLGKGWEEHVRRMREAGYEANHITFAPDYIEEICKHDIQITPISIGTGTKGKVLDALANGLLVIGTPYAMENIAVENGVSCIEYRDPKEVIEVLRDIVSNGNGTQISQISQITTDNREKYERIAEAGRQAVLTHHNRGKISAEIFQL